MQSKPHISPPAAAPDWRAEAEARGAVAFEAAVADPEPTADSNALAVGAEGQTIGERFGSVCALATKPSK
jgi:hypothetical protein